MKIAVIGRTEILYDTAELLAEKGHEIKLIITAKEAPEYTRTADDFEKLAGRLNARFLYTPKISAPENIEFIRNCGPIDIAVSVNYSSVISSEATSLFPYGILNAHGGDLPRYRGNACQAWAIINGEEKIGLCVHKMKGGELDSGDIIEKKYMPIDINTKVGKCYSWMAEEIPGMFASAVKKLETDKNYIMEKQSEKPEDALRCYPRCPDDGRVDWEKSNIEALRLINASSEPYAGAFCEFNGKIMRIWRARLFADNEKYCAMCGQIASIDKTSGAIIVICGDGKLQLDEVEFDGTRGKPAGFIKSIRERLK